MIAMRRQSGFTLVEIMVTIAILVILMTVGIPGFQRMMEQNQLATLSNDLLRSMTLARSEALKRGREVMVEPAQEAGWMQGWVVWTDTDGNGERSDSEVLRFIPGPGAGRLTLDQSPDRITYEPSGLAGDSGCFQLSGTGEGSVRSVQILPTGRAAVSGDACDTG
ncbi:hypothetical protein CKO33_11380 [Ectothiorhodospira mobilis]|nr:hypothetical protein [Ectothiorhodospira mobilis]